MSEWIDVNNKKPDDEVSVLVYQDGNGVCDYLIIQAQIFQGGWYADHDDGNIDFHDQISVNFWQPLPEPPHNT